jgi:hypothetical protein
MASASSIQVYSRGMDKRELEFKALSRKRRPGWSSKCVQDDLLGFSGEQIPCRLGLRNGTKTVPLGALKTGSMHEGGLVNLQNVVDVAVDIVWVGVVIVMPLTSCW